MTPIETRRAITYATTAPAASGSIETQQQLVAATADRLGLGIVEQFADEFLGPAVVRGDADGLAARPGLRLALHSLCADDTLIVASRTCFGANPIAAAVIEALIEAKAARVVAADESTEAGAVQHLRRQVFNALSSYDVLRETYYRELALRFANGERPEPDAYLVAWDLARAGNCVAVYEHDGFSIAVHENEPAA